MSFAFKKKTPFQKHKELEEDKKKRADLEAAKVYDEFVASFGGEEQKRRNSFVTGGTIVPGSRPPTEGSSRKSSKYVPSFVPPAMAAAMQAASNPTPKPEAPTPSSSRGAKKPRNIDIMLQNLKREQEERDERQRIRKEMGIADEPVDDYAGSLDENDPFTTNLYVGNLAPDVDEAVLAKEFGRFGQVTSVKIMWPRDDDQRRRGRNCGFVAFANRAAAQRAKDDLNGIMLHENELKIGWGKAVASAVTPAFAAMAPQAAAAVAAATAMKGVAVPPPGVEAPPPWSDPHAQAAAERRGPEEHRGSGPDIEVVPPADGRQRFVIDMVASFVLRDGPDFEQVLMERESANPEFAFMFDLQLPEHMYFRWRLYSLAQGDTQRSWRVEPFVMLEGGQRWVPPPMTGGSTAHQTAAQRGGEHRDKDQPLSELQRDKFEDLLRGLTAERAAVRDAMVFALDNADSAAEVVEILTEALTLSETPIPTKVARLFLASDILHNSTAPVRNASRYRARLEEALPDIFESLQDAYHTSDSRMAQEGLRRHVLRVLRIWRDWFIFGDDFLNGLQATFLRSKAAEAPQNPKLRAELEELDADALELRCRRSGVSRKGGAAQQVSRLLALHAYINGDAPVALARPLPQPQPAEPATGAAQTGNGLAWESGSGGVQAAGPVLGPFSEPDNVAAPAALPAAEAEKPAPLPRPAEPVSRWTEIDDDEDAAGGGMPVSAMLASPVASDDIFSDTSDGGAPGTATRRSAAAAAQNGGSGDFASRRRSVSAEPPLPDAVPSSQAQPAETGAGVERSDPDDEQRRARARKVEVALLEFREDLEDKGGLSKQQIEDRMRVKRAQLTVEMERQESAAAAASAAEEARAVRPSRRNSSRERSSRDDDRRRESRDAEPSRDRDRSRGREADRDRDRDRDRERDRERDRDRGRHRHDSHKSRDSSRSRSRGRRSRSRSRDHESKSRSRHKDAKRSRSRSPSRKDSKRRR